MRKIHLTGVAVVLAAVLLLPSSAAAQIDQLSISPTVKLGLEGASATVSVSFECEQGLIGPLSVTVVQETRMRRAQGFGAMDMTCTGQLQSVDMPVTFFEFALRPGKASTTATLRLDVSGSTVEQTIGPVPVRVRK